MILLQNKSLPMNSICNYNKRVVVTPTEGGQFINYEDDPKIEERCFPHLFPEGKGGYLSRYAPKRSLSQII